MNVAKPSDECFCWTRTALLGAVELPPPHIQLPRGSAEKVYQFRLQVTPGKALRAVTAGIEPSAGWLVVGQAA
jgi:hypothetical protein